MSDRFSANPHAPNYSHLAWRLRDYKRRLAHQLDLKRISEEQLHLLAAGRDEREAELGEARRIIKKHESTVLREAELPHEIAAATDHIAALEELIALTERRKAALARDLDERGSVK